MRKKSCIVALLVLPLCPPLSAEVVSSSDAGFEVSRTATVPATPAKAYEALGKPALWWSSDHSWSGDAKNMTLDLRAGGCFCEALPADKGSVEHGRIIYAQPGKMLRFSGVLGPLQSEAATGTMTWTLKAVPGGTEITQRYAVHGYSARGLKAIAPIVDGVLGQQLDRLAKHLGAK